MPPSSTFAANSADTKAVGIKKVIAAKIKKKTNVLPNKAAAGKLRMLSIAPVIKRVRANVLNLAVLVIFCQLYVVKIKSTLRFSKGRVKGKFTGKFFIIN